MNHVFVLRGGWRAMSSASVCVLGLMASAPARAQSASVSPWVYGDNGQMVWKRHEFREDTSNTIYSLAWDFIAAPGETVARPDVLMFNGPHFDPPEGVALQTGQTRKLYLASLYQRSLQLFVNYSDVPIVQGQTDPRYAQPTFFVSNANNSQTDPPVPDVGLSDVLICPTHAALGSFGLPVTPNARAPFAHEAPPPVYTMNAMYVTAGVGYDPATINVVDTEFVSATAADLCMDRLLVRGSNGVWTDQSSFVYGPVRSGNSSGVVFGDFDGDGYLDLFVGKPGNDYTGDQSRLLLYRPAAGSNPRGFYDYTTPNVPVMSLATVDVSAGDFDGDGDLDIVLANRTRRVGTVGTESVDCVLINDGTGTFRRQDLNAGIQTDTRCVAVGDLDPLKDTRPEIVLGNALTDEFSNLLDVAAAAHPLQIFRNHAAAGLLDMQDSVDEFITPANQPIVSRPFTMQVLLADVFSPAGSSPALTPDGARDVFLVNHRDILLDQSGANPAGRVASNVRVLINQKDASTRLLELPVAGPVDGRFDVRWATTLALADFTHNDDPNYGFCSANTLDMLVGTGNRFSGCDRVYFENRGSQAGGWPPWNNSDVLNNHMSYDAMPGNERGYGFDFADIEGNGSMDAVQTSRSYDFWAEALNTYGGHGSSAHWNLTGNASPVALSNKRGQLLPIGAEDAVFADFDRDGDLELLVATQSQASGTYPSNPHPQIWDTVLLRNLSLPLLFPNFQLDTAVVHSVDVPSPLPPGLTSDITVDAYIDIHGRDACYRPGTADRVIAVDLDNDGDEDAIVQLFPIRNPQSGVNPGIPLLDDAVFDADPNVHLTLDRYSAGWRYLQNVNGEAVTGVPMSPAPWFVDLAPSKLKRNPGGGQHIGGFSNEWNRALGTLLAADFDNNGACDFFSSTAGGATVGLDIATEYQAYDLLFLNAVAGNPAGVLVESCVPTQIPQRVRPGTNPAQIDGSNGIAQGDIDNDGDADVFVSAGVRTVGQLLINDLGVSGTFSDDFAARVPAPANGLKLIHSAEVGAPPNAVVHDNSGAPILVDLDGDGDLDLIYAVANNVPRIYRNRGTDANHDGLIDASDNGPNSQVGYFEEATADFISQVRPIVDSVDAQAVDIDRDGDFDLAIDCFDDEVVIWRNHASELLGPQPVVTEAWPRIGCIRGREVVLEGARLDHADRIELRSRATGVTKTISSGFTVDPQGRLHFTMPSDAPLGLVQVRVRGTYAVPVGQSRWGTQYFGYFVLGS